METVKSDASPAQDGFAGDPSAQVRENMLTPMRKELENESAEPQSPAFF